MSAFNFRPAIRENTPLIIGIAGPTKSGKTYSAHRLAQGIANGGQIAMLNAEGARGHQYADRFNYVACDIGAPYSYERYEEALLEVEKLKPACLIIDSMSHAHDGPGGMLEQHESELDRRAGNDYKKRDRMTWTAWIKPKAAENKFIYTMLSLNCPIILCFRAKEKMKIVAGQEPVNLGWQPIASDRIAFETIFTVTLPPHSKGVPDLALSEMRTPFDDMVPGNKPIDETLGRRLCEWAAGGKAKESAPPQKSEPARADDQSPSADGADPIEVEYITVDQATALEDLCKENKVPLADFKKKAGVERLSQIHAARFNSAVKWLNSKREAA